MQKDSTLNIYKATPLSNPKDLIEVEVGDSKQPDFKPQFKFMRWNNEVNFSMRAEEHPEATIESINGKIKYVTPDYEVHQYDKPDASEDGGFEFEWLLKSPPKSNVLTATVQTKELDFFYQPPLTEGEIAGGFERPDNVVGSYAVYHKTKRDNADGGQEYRTGKAFHIYRPLAKDADGAEVWCDLNIDAGLLTVTVPQKFLDEATYPIVVDPTFGYTSQGASDSVICSSSADNAAAWKVSGLAGGNATKISQYVKYSGGTPDQFKSFVWNDNGSGLPTNTTPPYSSAFTSIASTSYTLQEKTFSYVFSGATQWIGTAGYEQTGSGSSYVAYDSGGVSGDTARSNDLGTWGVSTERYSVYVTYTASNNYFLML